MMINPVTGEPWRIGELHDETAPWMGPDPQKRRSRPRNTSAPSNHSRGGKAWRTITASALDKLNFPELAFIVPGVLPEGLTLLAGRPKGGKSYMMGDIAQAVASGGLALGKIQCEAGDVLYAALEDNQRRLQSRTRQLRPFENKRPDRLHYATDWRRFDDGGLDDLREWLDAHPGARLVIFDTWARVKPGSRRASASAYDEDEAALRPLHDLAKSRPGVAFVVVHHVRKMEAADVFDTISGTMGLTGVVDGMLVLARNGDMIQLAGQGRDLEQFERVVTRDKLTGGWIIGGDATQLALTNERQLILDALREIGEPMTPTAIASEIGKTRSNVSHLLKRLLKEGKVERAGKGRWTFTSVIPFTDKGETG